MFCCTVKFIPFPVSRNLQNQNTTIGSFSAFFYKNVAFVMENDIFIYIEISLQKKRKCKCQTI